MGKEKKKWHPNELSDRSYDLRLAVLGLGASVSVEELSFLAREGLKKSNAVPERLNEGGTSLSLSLSL